METQNGTGKTPVAGAINEALFSEDVLRVAQSPVSKFTMRVGYEGHSLIFDMELNKGTQTSMRQVKSSIALASGQQAKPQVEAMTCVVHELTLSIDGVEYKKVKFPLYEMKVAIRQMLAEGQAHIDYHRLWKDDKAPDVEILLANGFMPVDELAEPTE